MYRKAKRAAPRQEPTRQNTHLECSEYRQEFPSWRPLIIPRAPQIRSHAAYARGVRRADRIIEDIRTSRANATTAVLLGVLSTPESLSTDMVGLIAGLAEFAAFACARDPATAFAWRESSRRGIHVCEG